MKAVPRILCVDDENSILRSIRRSFFDEEVHITGVTSGSEALEYCKKNEIDCIISDYLMPEMTGYELLETIKKRYPSVIRIMLSGYVEKEVILKSLFDYTAVTFFAKPWDEDLLKSRIYQLLECKRSVKQEKLWALINNGFPIRKELPAPLKVRIPVFTYTTGGRLEEFLRNDCLYYLKLLHLGNADYLNGSGTWALSELMDIPGRDYLEEVVSSDRRSPDSTGNYIHASMEITSVLYRDIYTMLFQETPPELPDYASIAQLDTYILASIAPGYLKNRIHAEKDLGSLVELMGKLWHLPDRIETFYRELHTDTSENKQIKALRISSRTADRVLGGEAATEVPSWWPLTDTQYREIIKKGEAFRK